MNRRLLLAVLLAGAPAPALAQGARDNIDALIEQHAKANGVPASFVHAVVKRESNYNARARGGSALGLMQIKHGTAKSLGYQGGADGLYDPETNLRYGVAYLAGAYRTARGNLAQAYSYYNRGYYYAAKRQGVASEVAEVVAPVAASASAVASLFTGTPPADNPAALAYAPSLAGPAPSERVAVPLPPRRPGALGGAAAAQVASLDPADAQGPVQASPVQASPVRTVEVPLPPQRPDRLAPGRAGEAGVAEAAGAPVLRLSPPGDAGATVAAQAIEVPLPPRRPAPTLLAAFVRPAGARRAPAAETVQGTVQEAAALPAE